MVMRFDYLAKGLREMRQLLLPKQDSASFQNSRNKFRIQWEQKKQKGFGTNDKIT